MWGSKFFSRWESEILKKNELCKFNIAPTYNREWRNPGFQVHPCPSAPAREVPFGQDTIFNLNDAGNISTGKIWEECVLSCLWNHLFIFKEVREDVNRDWNAELHKSAVYLFFHSFNIRILHDCINLAFHFLYDALTS